MNIILKKIYSKIKSIVVFRRSHFFATYPYNGNYRLNMSNVSNSMKLKELGYDDNSFNQGFKLKDHIKKETTYKTFHSAVNKTNMHFARKFHKFLLYK